VASFWQVARSNLNVIQSSLPSFEPLPSWLAEGSGLDQVSVEVAVEVAVEVVVELPPPDGLSDLEGFVVCEGEGVCSGCCSSAVGNTRTLPAGSLILPPATANAASEMPTAKARPPSAHNAVRMR
jgi:hypothetical protein